jgi:hypothetical protein
MRAYLPAWSTEDDDNDDNDNEREEQQHEKLESLFTEHDLYCDSYNYLVANHCGFCIRWGLESNLVPCVISSARALTILR